MNCPIARKLCDYHHSMLIWLQVVADLLDTARNCEDFLYEISLQVKFWAQEI